MVNILKFFSLTFSFSITLVTFFACRNVTSPQPPALTEEQMEVIEDSLQYVESKARQSEITASVTADAETGNVSSPLVDDDAADDMAVWVNAADPEKSTIIGTNKKGGVIVFDLQGKELAFYPTGRINNIDVLYGLRLGKEKIDLVGCTNRSDQSVDLFRINPADGTLTDISANALKMDTASMRDVYGFCFYHIDKPYLFVNGKNGMVRQYEVIVTVELKLDLNLVREIKFESQTEGMAVDELNKVLYVGEEDKGIWKVKTDMNTPPELVPGSGRDNPNISFDVEGLAIYKNGTEGYLLCSSQGNFSYAVFDRNHNNRYLGSFKITDGEKVDGVEETDGIEAVSTPLGKLFPEGVFIAQDGFNYDNGKLQRQNFKIVRWEKIRDTFGEK